MTTVKFKKLVEHAKVPEYAKPGDSGMDLYLSDAVVFLVPGGRLLVSTGIAVAIPPGFEGQIRPRSGNAAKLGVTVLNTPGTIDSGYRGELKVLLYNTDDHTHVFNRGDRIAQLVVAPVEYCDVEVVEELDETERGDGGFGSTGQ